MAASVASRYDPNLHELQQRPLSKGKVPKVTLAALMGKLVVPLNSQLKIHTPQTSPC